MKNQTSITLILNEEDRKLTISPKDTLLDALRDAGYVSVKRGCDVGDCGICTILFDGQPIRSCMIRAIDAEGHAVTTLEGLSRHGQLHPIQRAFMSVGGAQCGFCTPGLIMTTKALLDNPGVQKPH